MRVFKLGAELSLNSRGFTGPIGAARNALERLKDESGGTGAAVRGMAADLGKAAVAAMAAKKALDLYSAGVRQAQMLSREKIGLQIEITRKGDDPKKTLQDLKEYSKAAFTIQADVKGNIGDVLAMFASGKQVGISRDVMLGGLGRKAALLADVEGTEKSFALEKLFQVGTPFKYDPGKFGDVADLVYRYTHSGQLKFQQIVHEMARVGPAMAQGGGNLEDSLILLQSMGNIKPEEAGAAAEAFKRVLSQPKRKKAIERAGLDFFDKAGNIVAPEVMREQLLAKFGKLNPEQQGVELERLFPEISKLVPQALMATDVAGLRKKARGHISLEEALKLKQMTLEFQKGSVSGTVQSMAALAFQPGEKMQAGILKKIGDTLLAPIGEAIADSDAIQEGVSRGTLGAAGLGLGAAAFFGGRGLMRGLKGIKAGGGWKKVFMPDAFGTATGVAKGKLLEKTAGVQPVFVVNWNDAKGTFGGGAFGGAAGSGGLLDAFGRPIVRTPVSDVPAMAQPGRWSRYAGYGLAVGGGAAIATATAPVVREINEGIEKWMDAGGVKGWMGAANKAIPGLNPFKNVDDLTRVAGFGLGWAISAGADDEEGKKDYARAMGAEYEEYKRSLATVFAPLADLFKSDKAAQAAEQNAEAAREMKEAAGSFREIVLDLGNVLGAFHVDEKGTRGPGAMQSRGGS